MKFAVAFAAVLVGMASANPFAPAKTTSNAKAAYARKLMKGARPTENSQLRRLDENGEPIEVDISGYAIKFEQCQFVRTYDDELAEDEDSETVLATKRFVIFKLCPENQCSSCSYNYGEYLVDLDEYLQATVEYQAELQEEMCNACQECGNNQDQDGQDGEQNNAERRKLQDVDCDTCYEECQKIENMENNGYIDATNFLECQMVYDPEDDDKSALYAGPVCASNGSKIKIGMFKDEDCNVQDSSLDIEDYLMDGNNNPLRLSHALLKTVYSEDSCVSCLVPEEEDENNDGNDNNGEEKEAETLDLCQQLYEEAAKCEYETGFQAGYAQYEGYENQASQEGVVCDFIQSLKAGSYDEEGEIVVRGASGSFGGGSKTTGGQKFALSFFIIGTVGLAVYAAMLHSKLTKGSATLADQGGSLA